MLKNNLNFIFNAHLPFVRHPEYPKFLEEDWLYEAINESYIPFIRMMYRLRQENIKFRLTFSLSPTLCTMLSDELLKERFTQYLESRIELGEKEIERTANCPDQNILARKYTEDAKQNLDFYVNKCSKNILSAFNELSNEGYIELITTAATHAYLPNFRENHVAVNAQIEAGIINHYRAFDKLPEGFWLPECGYYPGLEKYLVRSNIKWTTVAAQAFFLSEDKVEKGNFAPVKTKDGFYFFARNHFLSNLVWSDTEGYPCDADYREFYRDIGYDLPWDYVQPYVHEPHVRVFTGFKYWAITGQTADKKPYNPEKANEKLNLHAANFIYNVKNQGRLLENRLDTDPVYTISFDAELFGHWWYEGISWLEKVIRLTSFEKNINLVTSSDVIRDNPDVQILTPAYSSWGTGGYSQVWTDSSSNAWMLRNAIKSVERMSEIAERFPLQKSLKQRFLNQAARETFLLMSSDWPFIVHNHTSEEYANKRFCSHVQNLNLVYENMSKNAVNTEWLVKAEKRDNLFQQIDYNIFNPKHLQEPSMVYTMDYTKGAK